MLLFQNRLIVDSFTKYGNSIIGVKVKGSWVDKFETETQKMFCNVIFHFNTSSTNYQNQNDSLLHYFHNYIRYSKYYPKHVTKLEVCRKSK